jgi:uncharacterized protein YeaO (DUF488 family)
MRIYTKRVYEKTSKKDGYRILVDRLWPRGISKKDVKVDLWLKEIAPSTKLRTWFGHDPAKWQDFKSSYFLELQKNPQLIAQIIEKAQVGAITLVFSSKEEKFNNAVALKEYLEKKLKSNK